jgi:hypothetical protein
MNNEELKKLLKEPQRILNIARVFHQLLHTIDKMEEEQVKGKTKGIQQTKVKDMLDITCKDKDGNIKANISQ